MAKQRTEFSEGRATPATDLAASTPEPAATLHVTLTVLAKGNVLYRVHQDIYQPDQFNPGVHGNARFSPIQDDQGRAIPTLYGGTTVDCALMETVFHDVPHTAGFKSFDKASWQGRCILPSRLVNRCTWLICPACRCVSWASHASN